MLETKLEATYPAVVMREPVMTLVREPNFVENRLANGAVKYDI